MFQASIKIKLTYKFFKGYISIGGNVSTVYIKLWTVGYTHDIPYGYELLGKYKLLFFAISIISAIFSYQKNKKIEKDKRTII